MKLKTWLLAVAAALAGLVAGGVLERARVAAEAAGRPAQDAAVKAAAPEPVTKRDLMALQSANDALREANERLRQRLSEAARPPADGFADYDDVPAATNANEVEAVDERRPRRESFAQRMERMRQENPEEYAERQRRREEFRQQITQLAYDRNDFLSSIDVKRMNAAQRENHEKLLATVDQVNGLLAEMDTAEGDRRRELGRAMAEAGMTLDALYAEERRYLFEETARSMGYRGDAAAAFADHVQGIIDNTSLMPDLRRGRGGRGGPTR